MRSTTGCILSTTLKPRSDIWRQPPITQPPLRDLFSNLAVSLDTFFFGCAVCQVPSSHWTREKAARSAAFLQWVGRGGVRLTIANCSPSAPPTHHNPRRSLRLIWLLYLRVVGPLGFHIGLEVAVSEQHTQLPNCERAFMTCATCPLLSTCCRCCKVSGSQGPKQACKSGSLREYVSFWCTSGDTADNNKHRSCRTSEPTRTPSSPGSHGMAERACVRAVRLWGHRSTPMHAVHLCRMSRFPWRCFLAGNSLTQTLARCSNHRVVFPWSGGTMEGPGAQISAV